MISAAADSRGAFAFRSVLRFVCGRVFAVGQRRAVFFQILVESRLLFFLSDGVNGFFGLAVNDAARYEQSCGNDRSELRMEKGLSRKELAEKLGTLQRNISYWEPGQRECGFDMLIKISDVLDVSVDYLLGKTDY